MTKLLFFILVHLTLNVSLSPVSAQCPTADFSVNKATFCLFENIQITNNSINSTNFFWDFCSQQNTSIENISILKNITNLSSPFDMTVIEDTSGVLRAFISSSGNGKLVRVDSLASYTNSPTVFDLGNIIPSVTGIDILQIDNNWFGIASSSNGSIYRLSFGSLLTNTPSIETLNGLSSISDSRGLKIIKDGNDYFAVNTGRASLQVIKFSLTLADNSYSELVTTIPNASFANSIDLIKDCSTWYGVVATGLGGTHLLKFHDGIFSTPSSSKISNLNTGGVKLIFETENYYAFLTDVNSKNLVRIDFGNSMSNTPSFTDLGDFSLGVSTALEITRKNASLKGFVLGLQDKNLNFITFIDNCGLFSSVETPKQIAYSSPGTYDITLYAFHENGSQASTTKTITVQNAQAPDISFSVDESRCLANTNTFTAIDNGDINSYSWDFNNDGIADNANNTAEYQFMAAGEHLVTLDVGATNGCSNSARQVVTLFPEPPTPDFVVANSTTCSNDLLMFTNLSDESALTGADISYSWDFDGQGSSNEKNPSYTFASGGTKQVSLSMTIPGCTSFFSKNINVIEGPSVDWSYTNNCFGEAIQFTNHSSGDNITQYIWGFGDESPSTTIENPSHVYSNTGTYTVKLTVENSTGCKTALTKNIIISDLPKVSFEYDQSVENIPTNFTSQDLTASDDSIISWLWDFSGLGSSTLENSSFTFTKPGEYEVTLQVQTQQGCSDSFSSVIEVVKAQCPTADFSVNKATFCLFENIQITNNSINSTNFFWDFCSQQNTSIENISILKNITNLSSPFDMTVIEDTSGVLRAFISSSGNGKLVRVDSLASYTNSPTVFDLGNIIPSVTGIDILQIDNNWFGIASSSNGSIYRLSFGSLLTNTPSIETLNGLSSISDSRGLKIIKDGNDYFAVNTGRASLQVIKFSLTLADNSYSELVTTIPNASFANSIDLIKDCSTWYGVVATGLGGTHLLKFHDGIFSTPSSSKISNLNTGGVKLIFETENYYAFLTDVNSKNLVRIDFGNSMSNTPSFTDLGDFSLGVSTALEITRKNASLKGFVLGLQDKNLNFITFIDNCGLFSSVETPKQIAYSSPGTYDITLYAFHENGSQASMTKTITVQNAQAPDISFSVDESRCLANTNTFTAIDNGDINSYSWDFNNDGIADNANNTAEYQFMAAGEHLVTLDVGATNGCSNSARQVVTLFPEPPTPDFVVANSTTCSNDLLMFTNLSDESALTGADISYSWDFDGQGSSNEKNPSYTFASGGTKQVSLSMTIPGCTSFFSKNINVIEGPSVGFTADNSCASSEIIFSNTTTGDNIVRYAWDFGDGFSNTTENPTHSYEQPGEYWVTLTSENTSGCTNTIRKSITIHAIPEVNFTHELACQNAPILFTDNSTAQNANITAWYWDFDGQGSSTEQNPQFTFTNTGQYNITLTAHTNFGCSETYSKTITVNPAPVVDFNINTGCLGNETQFEDATVTAEENPITGWYWEIDNQVFTNPDPAYTFQTTGNHTVRLTVTPANNCAVKISKEVYIEPLPIADFSVSNTCNNELTLFTDESNFTHTSIVSRTWTFDGQTTANGVKAAHRFVQPGNHEVTLTITNENGCSDTISKVIEIFDSPDAAFEVDVDFGAPPLEVQFTNNSTGASDYVWYFDDANNTTSTEVNPAFTFNEVKDFNVKLEATNSDGCTDIMYKKIVSSIPVLDLELSKVEPSLDNGKIKLTLTVLNRGTVKINGFDIFIALDNNLTITESYDNFLNAGDQIIYPLNFEIPASGSNIGHICITLESINTNGNDTMPNNNEKCTNLSERIVIENPYPNPAHEHTTLSLITPSSSSVNLSLLNIHGKTVYSQSFPNLVAGLNTITIDLKSFNKGMYFLKINTPTTETIKRILKQ